jgi:hypothetical protein
MPGVLMREGQKPVIPALKMTTIPVRSYQTPVGLQLQKLGPEPLVRIIIAVQLLFGCVLR